MQERYERENKDLLLMERRAGTRQRCPQRQSIDAAVCPQFGSFRPVIRDIFEHGVGLLCDTAIPAGSDLILLVKPHGRLARAHVVHVTRFRDGVWYVGCALAEPLTAEEMRVYLSAGD